MTSLKDRTVAVTGRDEEALAAAYDDPDGTVTPEVGFVPAIYVPRRVVRRPARRVARFPDGNTWIVQERGHAAR